MFVNSWSRRAFGLLSAVSLLAACSTPKSEITPSLSAATSPTRSPNGGQAPESSAITLTIWVPPQFDGTDGGQGASLLQSHLSDFSNQHQGVHINVRVKAEVGQGGMLDSLLGAQAVAPLALPDLVLLPAQLMPIAADNKLLQPIGSLSEALNSDDWYPFARQLASWQQEDYGLPFAADAIVLAYRSTAIPQAPTSWLSLLDLRQAMGFAAADPLATFAITQLLSLQSDKGAASKLTLDETNLAKLFNLLNDGQAKDVFPFWLAQYGTSEQSWQAFTEGQLPMTAAWISQVFGTHQSEIEGAPLPTQDGQPFTVVKGWVWIVCSTSAPRAALAAQLAEFLTTPEFMAQFSAAANLLPARPSSLAAWSPDERQALASEIISTAIALPDQRSWEKWGAGLTPAVVNILKQETTVQDAVESVRQAISNSQ